MITMQATSNPAGNYIKDEIFFFFFGWIKDEIFNDLALQFVSVA